MENGPSGLGIRGNQVNKDIFPYKIQFLINKSKKGKEITYDIQAGEKESKFFNANHKNQKISNVLA